MANVTETSNFDEGIYQLETTDPVEGGALGIANRQAKGLANRTRWLRDNLSLALPGDIKEVDCSNAYILANFDPTGLGKNERLGWAICNGNNGTRNRNGRTSIAYGTDYDIMGDIGGSKNAILVAHSHKSVSTVNPTSEYTDTNKYTAAFRTSGGDTQYGLQGTSTLPTRGDTTEAGESGVGRNMQPYIVSLFIQKI